MSKKNILTYIIRLICTSNNEEYSLLQFSIEIGLQGEPFVVIFDFIWSSMGVKITHAKELNIKCRKLDCAIKIYFVHMLNI